jgi:tetratricopeptide (TPR) repeat protein
MVEYRLYLPSAGLLLAGTVMLFVFFDMLKKGNPSVNKMQTPTLVLIILVMSVAAYERNNVWANELTLWKDAAGKSPEKHRPQYNIARAYYAEGMLKEAIHHYETALKITLSDEDTHFNLAIAYSDAGIKDKAIVHYKEAIRLNPGRTRAHFNLAVLYISQDRLESARRELDEVLELEPGHSRARNFLEYVNKEHPR